MLCVLIVFGFCFVIINQHHSIWIWTAIISRTSTNRRITVTWQRKFTFGYLNACIHVPALSYYRYITPYQSLILIRAVTIPVVDIEIHTVPTSRESEPVPVTIAFHNPLRNGSPMLAILCGPAPTKHCPSFRRAYVIRRYFPQTCSNWPHKR